MKIKTLKNVALGIGCLMLTLTLSLNLILTASKPIHVIQPMEDMPVAIVRHVIQPMEDIPGLGMNKPSEGIIHIDEEMPFGMTKVNHVIKLMDDSPVG